MPCQQVLPRRAGGSKGVESDWRVFILEIRLREAVLMMGYWAEPASDKGFVMGGRPGRARASAKP